MRARRFIVASATMFATCMSAALGACATDEAASPTAFDAAQAVPRSDADEAVGDAAPPCTSDCEYFPACSAEILCPNGLFDPANPSGEHLDARTRIHLVRGRSATDVWALGALGAIVHFDGTSWERSELAPGHQSPLGRAPTLAALFLRDSHEVGVVGLDQFVTRGLAGPPDASVDEGGWMDRGPAALTFEPPFMLAYQGVMSGWAAPQSEWLWLATGSADPNAPSGVIRVGATPSSSFEGSVAATRSGTFFGLHGASADDLWAVGTNGTILRVTEASGASPKVTAYNSQSRSALYGVWAASESDVWAVGFAGTIRHYVGHPLLWEIASDIPSGVELNAVWGSSSSDVWAVGNAGVVLHYDGVRWSRMKIGGLGSRRPDLTTVWTAGPGHVWVGGDGVLLSLGGHR